ncbi:MAG TPA: ABC transporter permease, partial [Gemmatimonadaceae bacterium]
MTSQTVFRMALRSIFKNKMRTALTMLGIVIGVGAVIVMVAIGNGAQAQIKNQISGLGTNLIVITAGSVQTGGASQGAQSFNRLTVDDVDASHREATLLAGVSPVIVTRTQIVGGAGNWRAEVDGVSPDFFSIRDWATTSGDL